MNKKVIVYFNENGYYCIGPDYTHIIELKTIKGVLNRINKKEYYLKKDLKYCLILSYYEWDKMCKKMDNIKNYNAISYANMNDLIVYKTKRYYENN